MPTFTANGPDAGLTNLANGSNNLLSAIIGDPAKNAQAGYYGAEAGRAQLQAQILRDQINAGGQLNDALTTAFGGAPPAPGQTASPAAPPAPGPAPAPAPGAPPTTLADTIAPNPSPAPVVSPAPASGAPPAPSATGTNGQPIPNDPTAGAIHPGSITPPDGGMKVTGPAAPNGSPAPIALGPLFAIALKASGYNVEAAKGLVAAGLITAFAQHRIDHDAYTQYLGGLGLPQLYGEDQATKRTDMTNKTSITTTGMNNATTLATTGMNNDAAQKRQDTTLHTVMGPNGPVESTNKDAVGQPAYDANLYEDQRKQIPMKVGPNPPLGSNLPANGVVLMSKNDAAKLPPGTLVPRTTQDEELNRTLDTPANMTVQNPPPGSSWTKGSTVWISPNAARQLPQGTFSAQTQEDRAPVSTQIPGTGLSTLSSTGEVMANKSPLTSTASPEKFGENYAQYNPIQQRNIEDTYALSGNSWTNNDEPATLKPEARLDWQKRAQFYSTQPDFKTQPGAIPLQVTSDMIADGVQPKPADFDRTISTASAAGRFTQLPVRDKAGNPTSTMRNHIIVPYWPDKFKPVSRSGRALAGSGALSSIIPGDAPAQPPAQPAWIDAFGGGTAPSSAPPSLAQTVAPSPPPPAARPIVVPQPQAPQPQAPQPQAPQAQAPGQPPPGAVAKAPPNAVDGNVIAGPNGQMGVAKGGWIYQVGPTRAAVGAQRSASR